MTEFDDRNQTAAEPWAWTKIKQRKLSSVIETRGCIRWPEIRGCIRWPEMTVCIT